MGGCLAVVLLILAIGIFALYIAGVIIAIDIVSLILFVASILSYSRANKIHASVMKCPNCGSINVKLSTIKSGTTVNANFYRGFYNRTSAIQYKRMANCQECGFSWDFITQDDITQERSSARARMIFFGVIFALCAGFSLWLFSGDIEEGEKSEQSGSIWLDGYTDINDFDYYIDGEELFLTNFDSKEKKVRIDSSYEIDGNMYSVVSLDGVFTLSNVTSVIIPEGVRSIARNEFNSCGIEFLYLPSTLQNVGDDYFWDYFHDVEKIYYGGSEEQWNQLCTVDRSEIDAKQIIFDANSDGLK